MGIPVKELIDLTKLVKVLQDNEVVAEVKVYKKKKVIFNAKFTPELINLAKLPF